MHDDLAAPEIITIDGTPWWQFSTGEALPVISGGFEDPPEPDPDPDPDPAPDPDPDLPEPEKFDPARAQEKIKKANSEAAGLRKRLKELEPLAKKAKELEDASKSETEKLTERATAAETKAQEAELRALRLEVAADKGLSAAQARRLIGTTKEELEADADDLVESFGSTKSKTSPGGGKPKERFRGGSDPTDEPDELDPEKLASKVSREY